MKLFKEIYKLIKKYHTIVIARHIGADPDALGSQFALKEVIKENFKDKEVYAVGSTASKFRFMGNLDKPEDIELSQTLLIVLDTPDKKRIDGIEELEKYGDVIKIDHHPFVEKFSNIEYIEECSSTSQLIFKFVLENKLKMNNKIAENIYLGIVGDTDRFLHDYTTSETIELTSKLLNMSNIDFTNLYSYIYSRPLNEVKLEGYIYQNLELTKNNVAYIKITDEILQKYEVDSAAAGNMINNLKYVNEILVWAFFSEDKKMNVIKANIRSRGPIINETASKYGGGGHKYASGARLKSWLEVDNLIKDLDEIASTYSTE